MGTVVVAALVVAVFTLEPSDRRAKPNGPAIPPSSAPLNGDGGRPATLERWPASDAELPLAERSTEALVPMVAAPPAGFVWSYGYPALRDPPPRGESLMVFGPDYGQWFVVRLSRFAGWRANSDTHVLSDGQIAYVSTTGTADTERTVAGISNRQWTLSVSGPLSPDEALAALDSAGWLNGQLVVDHHPDARLVRIASSDAGGEPWVRPHSTLLTMAPDPAAPGATNSDDRISIRTEAVLTAERLEAWRVVLDSYEPSFDMRWGPSPNTSGNTVVMVPMVGQVVFIEGTASWQELLEVARTLRPAMPAEWDQLLEGFYFDNQGADES
jgi:hypothetical protein